MSTAQFDPKLRLSLGPRAAFCSTPFVLSDGGLFAERFGLILHAVFKSSWKTMRSTIITREFVIADYEAAVALWSEVKGVEVAEGDLRNEIQDYLSRNPGLSRIAEDNGTPVGAVLCGHDGRRGFIYHLAVAPAYQRKGIGERLLRECLSKLRKIGIKRAIILVSGNNVAGRSFWIRNGWEDIGGAIPMGFDL